MSLITPYDAYRYRRAESIDTENGEAHPQDLLLLDFSPFSARRRRGLPSSSSRQSLISETQSETDEGVEQAEEEMTIDDESQWSDFNSDMSKHDPLEVDVVDDKSCIERAECWESDVWTGLPYVRIRKEVGIVANGVMMDDQRIMMVKVRSLALSECGLIATADAISVDS